MASPIIRIACVANQYIRALYFEKAGDQEKGHKHPYDHFHFLASGSILLEIPEDKIKQIYKAPYLIFIAKEKTHIITAEEDNTNGICLHVVRDNDGEIIPFDSIPIDESVKNLSHVKSFIRS